MLEWDWPTAEAAFRRAIDLDANHAWSHSMLAHVLSQTGRHSEAAIASGRARELDPLSAVHYAMSSQVAYQARDYSRALGYPRQPKTLASNFWGRHLMRGL